MAYKAGARLDVVVSPWNEDWKDIIPWVEEWHVTHLTAYKRGQKTLVDKISGWISFLTLGFRLRGKHYDAIIDLRMVKGDWRGKLFSWLIGAPVRIGSEGCGEFFLTAIHIPQAISVEDQIKDRLGSIISLDQNSHGIETTLTKNEISRGGVRIIMHIGSGTSAKQWKEEFWKELALLLHEKYQDLVHLILMGGPSDVEFVGRIMEACFTFNIQTLFPSNLRIALYELSNCSLLVCLDSAAQHLARLVGTPTVTIFASTDDPKKWGAMGDNTILHQPPPCSLCKLSECNKPDHPCMTSITPSMVANAVFNKLTVSNILKP